ncbi:hypothetical protein Ancab_032633 [Ancistrocladus abbreviatus]
MVAKNSSDWPPPGWKIHVQVKNGRKIKSYINKNLGQKLYSKAAVVRCINSGSINVKMTQPMNGDIKRSSVRKGNQVVKKINEFPDWLPDGWTMEWRTRKSGSKKGTKYKCYIDLSTGSTFYSVPEVSRYLETLRHSASSSQTKSGAYLDLLSDAKSASESRASRYLTTRQGKKHLQSTSDPNVLKNARTHMGKKCLLKRRKVVIENSVDQGLPPGWIKEIRTKQTGDKTRRDLFYINAEIGYVFRSRKDVDRYLETGVVSRHAYKRKNCGVNEELTGSIKTSPLSAKRKKIDQSAVQTQLCAGAENDEESTPAMHTKGGQAEWSAAEADSCLPPSLDIVQEEYLVDSRIKQDIEAEANGDLKTVAPPKSQDSDENRDISFLMDTKPISSPSKNVLLEKKPEDLDDEQNKGQSTGSSFVSILPPDIIQEKWPGLSTTGKVAPKEGNNVCGKSLPNAQDADCNGSKIIVMGSELASAPAKDILLEKPQDAEGLLGECLSEASFVSVQTPNVLQEKYFVESVVEKGAQTEESNLSRLGPPEQQKSKPEKCIIKEAQVSNPRSKNRKRSGKEHILPCRSSKRLAGIEAEPMTSLVPIERAVRGTRRTSGKAAVMPTLDSVPHEFTPGSSGLIPQEATLGNSQQLDVDAQREFARHASCSSEDPLNEELLKVIEKLFESPSDDMSLGVIENLLEDPVAEQQSANLEVNGNNPFTEWQSSRLEANGIHPIAKQQSASSESNGNHLVAEQQSANAEAKGNHRVAQQKSANMEVNGDRTVSEQRSASLEVNGNNSKQQSVRQEATVEQQSASLEANGRDGEQPESQFCVPALFADPCLEFAFKTLTGAIPLEDNHQLAIQDYVQHQLRASAQSNSSFTLSNISASDFSSYGAPSQFDVSDQHHLQNKPASSLPGNQALVDISEDRPPGF